MARLAVAVSGGADSLFALVSLQIQGHEVLAVHGLFLPNAAVPPALEELCHKLGIALHVVDMRAHFAHSVMQPFVRAYASGITPNPCALCNAQIKFGALLDAALALGADKLATGHYAALRPQAHYDTLGRALLTQAADSSKDQSYFLALVPAEKLALACFPLANTHKKDAMATLAAKGLPIPLPGESQEICFVPADAYRPFVQSMAESMGLPLPGPGPMLVQDGQETRQVGEHKGLWHYTEGQRRGLCVAWKEALYVQRKDKQRNALWLAPAHQLTLRGCLVRQNNSMVPWERWPSTVLARVRYRQSAVAATVTRQEDTQGCFLRVTLSEGQPPTACGQVAALYDSQGFVLNGGIIAETF